MISICEFNMTARPFRLFLLLAVWGMLIPPAFSQDDFSVPGLDKPAPAAAPAAPGNAGAAGDKPVAGAVEEGPKSLLDMIREGGWAMWPLGAMSLAIIGLTIYLLIDLTRKNFVPPDLVNRLARAMERGDIGEGLQVAAGSPTCLGQVMNGALAYTAKRGYHVLDQDTIYDLMADASQIFNRGRAKTINYLSVISQAAPMLGLLGTVSGMIKAFATLGSSGMGNPSELAGNISEALVTTAAGLVIALPAIFLYFFFRDKLSEMITSTEVDATRLLNTLRDVIFSMYQEQEGEVPQEQA